MSFPRYPKYKDSGVEWLGEVPEHWEVRRLKFLCDIQLATETQRTPSRTAHIRSSCARKRWSASTHARLTVKQS